MIRFAEVFPAEEILSALGLMDLESPEQALFTSFNDPYIMATFGTFGVEVPLEPMDSLVVEPGDILETDDSPSLEAEGATVVEAPETAAETASSDTGVQEGPSGKEPQAEPEAAEAGEPSKPETEARVTEIKGTEIQQTGVAPHASRGRNFRRAAEGYHPFPEPDSGRRMPRSPARSFIAPSPVLTAETHSPSSLL